MQTVAYQLTVEDLVDARDYTHRTLPLVRGIKLTVFILTLACACLVAYRAVQGDWTGVIGLAPWLVLGLVLTVWALIANRLLLPHFARQSYARSRNLHGEVIASWDAERITFESSHGQARWPWSDFYKWQESPGGLLLWPGDRIFNYLPKRALTDEQASDIRGHLAGALGGPGARKR